MYFIFRFHFYSVFNNSKLNSVIFYAAALYDQNILNNN